MFKEKAFGGDGSSAYKKIELADGTTSGETAGGFTKAADAKDINFMIIQKGALLQYPKHIVNKITKGVRV